MRIALVGSIGLLGAGVVLFGASEKFQAWTNIHSGSLSLVQTYLALNLAVLVSSWRVGMNLPSPGLRRTIAYMLLVFPVYGVAIINLGLVVCLVFDFSTERLWLLGLSPPAIAAGWLFFRLSDESARDHASAGAGLSEKRLDESNREGHSSAEAVANDSAGWFMAAAVSAITLPLIVLWFGLGALVFELMRLAVFEGAVLPLERLLQAIKDDFWLELGLYAAIIPLAVVVLLAILGLGRFVIARFLSGDPRRYRRRLTEAEQEFLVAARERLAEYASAQTYPRYWAFLAVAAIPLGGMAIGMACATSGAYFLTLLLRNSVALSDYNDIVLESDIIGFAVVLGVFAGITLIWPLGQIAGRTSAGFAEFLYLRCGWNTTNSQARPPEQLARELEFDLRRDRLKPDTEFDPGAYVQQAYRRYDGASAAVGSLAIAVTLVFTVLDAFSFQAFTRDEMIRSGYWSFARESYRYGDAAGLETACYSGERDDQPAFFTKYHLVTENGRRFRLDELLERGELAVIEQIDAQVRAASVERVEYERSGLFGGNVGPAVDSTCSSELERRFGEDADRVRRILHLEPQAERGG
ncbi:hypothetical protein DDZ18_05395 [Marinicauda salina]|uniref:Uncharacterized protein n=1 Tax=Marinicauda salina TaxID=2135793 RepID=A0A2U2BVH1_9PROT|nr:hypothetical protein DDZ18_05395 [Marinicauda salina]